MAELHEWRKDHESILRSLGLARGLPTSELPISKAKKGADIDAVPKRTRSDAGIYSKGDGAPISMDVDEKFQEGCENQRGGGSTIGERAGSKGLTRKMSLQNLSSCIHAAEKITVGRSLKEVREMRLVLQKVNDWVEQCQSLCPRRQSKRRVQASNKPTVDRFQALIAKGIASPVDLADEVDRIRRHIAEALSWQVNAKSVLEAVSTAFSEQTAERKEIWRKEEEESHEQSSSGKDGSGLDTPAPKAGELPSLEKSSETLNILESTVQPKVEQTKEECGVEGKTGTGSAEQGSDSADDESDGNDREDELDEQEESNEAALQELLTTARDISIFMPEELVTERVGRIMEWAR